MTNNTRIAILISTMVNAVIFGIGTVTILSTPALNANAIYLLPAWIVLNFIVSPFVSKALAPRMRSKLWHDQHTLTH